MNFIQSIKTCFRKYADFKGRAIRSEFWWFQLFMIVLTYAAMTIDILFLGYALDDTITPLATIVTVVLFVPSFSVAARRLHDIGWSGWFQLPVLLAYSTYLDVFRPDFSVSSMGAGLMIAGMLFWFALYIVSIKRSQPNANKYGPNPKTENAALVFT